jgi:GAF domain-containing protein
VLHEVALVSTQVESIDELIEHATEIIGNSLFPDNFGILLMDEEKDVLHPHPSYRFVSARESIPAEVPLGQGVTGEVARTGQPVRIGNIAGVGNYLDIDQRTSSELCVPIRFKDRILGVINAESARTDAFSMDDEVLLGTLAGQLATAIEQLRAAAAEHQWLDQLAHSNELINALAHISARLEKALTQEAIIKSLGQELDAISLNCVMAMYDADRRSFTIKYASIPPALLEKLEKGIGLPLVEYTFSLDKLSSLENARDPRQPAAVSNPEDEIQLFLSKRREQALAAILQVAEVQPQAEPLRLPLVFEENLLGILWLWGKDLTRADLPVMSIFAKQIASSLERARLFQEVQGLALIDPLTGLQNRRSLFELGRIEFSRAERMQRPFCCMMVDVDRFKQVNDRYGHPVGDQVLHELAKRCASSLRAVDLIARYGGDELIILMPETDADAALPAAERLRAAIE